MSTQTLTLTDFLLARIAEDEAWARLARERCPSPWWQNSGVPKDRVISAGKNAAHAAAPNVARFIARHDPARVLAECEAKRRIVAMATPECDPGCKHPPFEPELIRVLAAVYSAHPDYREEWRP